MIIVCILLLPSVVKAEEYITVTCTKGKDEYICNFTLKYEEEVSAIELTYSLPKNVTVKKYIKNSAWEGSNDNNQISLYTDVNKIGVIDMGNIYLSSKKEIKNEDIKIEKLLIYDSSYEEKELINNVKNNENKVKKRNKWTYIIIACVIIIIGIVVVIIRKKKGDAA